MLKLKYQEYVLDFKYQHKHLVVKLNRAKIELNIKDFIIMEMKKLI